jgi:hypothetical protein
MPITRGQMKRQLYMGGGIMNAVPREQYGLGSVFKKAKKAAKGAVKTVKKIASSDLGKAALLAAAGAYAGGLGPFSATGRFGTLKGAGFAQGLFPSVMDYSTPTRSFFTEAGKIGSKFLGTGGDKGSGLLTKGLALAGLSTFLTSQYGLTEEQAQEELNDPEKLPSYLRAYYTNLNPNAGSEEIEEFVRVNSATGGRIGFADGPVLPPDPTQPVNPFGPKPPADAPVLPDRRMASDDTNERVLEALFEKYLDMGLSPKDAADAARKEFQEMSMMRLEDRGLAALGGRIKFAKGTDENIPNNPEARDMASFAKLEDYINPSNFFMNPRETDDFQTMQKERFMYGAKSSNTMLDKIKALFNKLLEMGLSPDEAAEKAREALGLRMNEASGGRIKKALGDSASMNAMQAAGIEGLPIRQNPRGVKELDLRKTGGFIPPVGIKEKADDIPAMLSNNEFVFTADAVRGAGGGDVNVGAQRMYDTMKRLEAGGKA